MIQKHISRRYVSIALLLALVSVGGAWKCGGTTQPKTVADALTTMGNIKREAKKAGEITAQQDFDISQKLHTANRAYKKFVTDEQARLAAGTPDPSARAAALQQLRSLLTGINDPSQLGFKSQKARTAWTGAITALNTFLAAFGG